MNDAIFKFKRYEDASLTYTGIDKHTNDEVGGWDTTIRRAQFKNLFYNQQKSMTNDSDDLYLNKTVNSEMERSGVKRIKEPEEVKQSKQPTAIIIPSQPTKSVPIVTTIHEEPTREELETRLKTVDVDSIVLHKKFGKGKVVKFNKNEKYIYVKFYEGEKKFIFPDAFLNGFLELD